ncbi:MAG TPA: DUF4139 domain-containing protein [Desulfomonilaceae bacterium]|nr:DUF4139 domain-containing protein [Desulfomonilaceae bacterium]
MKIGHLMISLVLMFPCMLSAAEPVYKSSAEDRIGLELTVYNSNLGLVKDTRTVDLPKGQGELRFMDVAASIKPVTVAAKSVNDPQGFSVLEQNYEYDLMNPAKLLDKYVGEQIKIIDWNRFQDRKEIVDATLLSNNNGPVYKINDEIYLGHPGYQVLPKLPENLIAKPTLTWFYRNSAAKPHDLEVSYLTQNINWQADYVVVLNKDDTAADISGWVTLDNQSGTSYKDARLKLVAGEVHQVHDTVPTSAFPAAAQKRKADTFQEKAFFEYHMYDLQRRTTVKDKQTKQISLLDAYGAGIRKELLVYGIQSYFSMQYREKLPKQPVNVYVTFNNSQGNHLGMPLPAGIMRLYKQDDDASRQFIGEDKIRHTPKDEDVRLKIGEAFDVVADRIQSDYKQITTRLHESAWEITLRNHKDTAVTVGVIEPLFGSWEVIDKSHAFTKVDAHTIRFDVNVPKDQEVKVKYRVRVGLQ